MEVEDGYAPISVFEIALKHSIGRLALRRPPGELIPEVQAMYGIRSLPLDEESALQLSRLPRLHADPFDRLLVCQAIEHGLAIVTPDPAIAQYPVRVLW